MIDFRSNNLRVFLVEVEFQISMVMTINLLKDTWKWEITF